MFKLKYSIPNEFTNNGYNCYSFKININLHIINFYNKIHFKVNIFDIMPREIIQSNRTFYKPLIIGYIKQKEKELLLQSIPFPLKMIILTYFQLF